MHSTVEENANDDIRIQFGDQFPPLSYYDFENWETNERHLVEFYPNRWYDVILLSTETPNFLDYFSECDDSPISLDLEWESELCLFQFCFNNKVVILRHPNGEGNKKLLNFLLTHKFYAKGINNDKKQLHKKFDTNEIANNIEDIAKTRLIPYNYSENFMAMVRQFSGEPTAEFKDIRITTSNWELPNLTKRQILYAAFDVVSLKECYPNYPPPKEISKTKSNNNDSNNSDDNDNSTKKQKKMRKSIIPNENKSEHKSEHTYEIKRIFSSPDTNSTISTTPTILEKCKRNVKLKRSPAREITGFIVKGYKGPKNIYSIKQIFNDKRPETQENTTYSPEESTFLHDDFSNIDFASTFDDRLFIGYYELFDEEKLTAKFSKYGDSFIKIQPTSTINDLSISAEESTDGDVLFVRNISESLIKKFDMLLFCFGANHEFATYKDDENSFNYIRIEPREASSSYRIKLFLSRFEFEGKTAIVSEFPYFLPKVRINNVPCHFTEKELRQLFEKAGKITKIEILRRRVNQDKQTAFITYEKTSEADKAVELFNHLRIVKENTIKSDTKNDYCSNMDLFLNNNLSSIEELNNELKVFRFSDEPHLRFMRRYEIRDTRVELFKSNSTELQKHYSKYGRIHLCFFDPFFNVGRVQFYDKKDAISASKSEKCEMTEESKIIVIRDLPFETTDSEILKLCSQFGEIVNLITRDINNLMRFIIKEVSFSSNEEANKAKSYFSSIKTIHGAAIRVAVLNGGFNFAPDWKMRQRKHWVKFVGEKPDDEFISKHEKKGKIVKIEYKVCDTKMVVAQPVASEDSDNNDQVLMAPVTVSKPMEFTYLMFQDFESTRAYNDNIYPTIEEFVEFLNPNELYIDKCVIRVECPNENTDKNDESADDELNSRRSNSQPVNLKASFEERKPVQMAILIDPIPDFVTKSMIVDYLGEFAENCDVFISASMRKNNNNENASENSEYNNANETDSNKEKTTNDENSNENSEYKDANEADANKEINEQIINNENSCDANNEIYEKAINNENSCDANNEIYEKAINNENSNENSEYKDASETDTNNDLYDNSNEMNQLFNEEIDDTNYNNNNNNNDDDDEDEESENENDSLDEFPGPMRRAVLVPTSRTLTNKIYSMMNDRPITDSCNSELLKPVRMRFENVPNSPTIRRREKIIVKQESKKMTIVVDPLPPRMKITDIEHLCGNFGKYSLTITGSAIVEGRKRALIHPLSCRAKKHIFRAMSIVFDDEEIVPVRMFPRDIPPPIESSHDNSNINSDSTSTSISA